MVTEVKSVEKNISIEVQDPLWYSDTSDTFHVLTKEIQSYNHTIIADGGYDNAQFVISGDNILIDNWLDKGLGRHIIVRSTTAKLIWEGFVNKVTIGIGTLTASRGPLFDIANRVSVTYTPIIDIGVDPPVTGSETETPIAEDTDSQTRYGILEQVLSGGQLLDDGTYDDAEEMRDLYLAEYAWPFTDETVNLETSAVPTITIECMGYKHWLNVYVHNDYTTGTVTLDNKVKYVLNNDPNGIFSTDQIHIDSNAQLTGRYEDKNRYAKAIIDEIVALGDGSDNRWTFSVYDDRLCYYEAIPTEVEYYHNLSSTHILSTKMHTPLEPWDFRPGAWVEISDFMPGESISVTQTPIRKDPRVLFVESVQFTAPNNLTLSGSRISTFTQRLSQLGANYGI
jgi:hypothetical protein